MAVSTQASVLAWRRVANAIHSFSPSTQLAFQALKRYLVEQGGNPDLQFVPFDELSDTDVVLITAGGAGKLYGVALKKDTATATFTKFTDHASASSDTAADIVVKNAQIGDQALLFPEGLALASGLVAQGNTTADGGTGSGTNGCSGFVLIGAA